MIFAL